MIAQEITKEILNEALSEEGRKFSLQEIRKRIINAGGTLMLGSGYLVKDYLEEQVKSQVLDFDSTSSIYTVREPVDHQTLTIAALQNEIENLKREVAEIRSTMEEILEDQKRHRSIFS